MLFASLCSGGRTDDSGALLLSIFLPSSNWALQISRSRFRAYWLEYVPVQFKCKVTLAKREAASPLRIRLVIGQTAGHCTVHSALSSSIITQGQIDGSYCSEEILSRLDIMIIKCLSLASSILRKACIPYIFRTLYLYGFMTTFFKDMIGQSPMPCLHTIKIEGLWDDVSTDLFPWCTKAHTIHSTLPTLIIPRLFPP